MRIADPRPGYCSSCFNADQEHRYVDFEAAFDGAPVLDRETNTIAVLPWNGLQPSHDDLYLCEACVQQAAEKLAFKPQLHARLLQTNKELRDELEHWKQTAKRQQAELQEQMNANLSQADSRRRKVAV